MMRMMKMRMKMMMRGARRAYHTLFASHPTIYRPPHTSTQLQNRTNIQLKHDSLLKMTLNDRAWQSNAYSVPNLAASRLCPVHDERTTSLTKKAIPEPIKRRMRIKRCFPHRREKRVTKIKQISNPSFTSSSTVYSHENNHIPRFPSLGYYTNIDAQQWNEARGEHTADKTRLIGDLLPK